jgi:ferritin-like metal-binding protein YciE
MAARFDKARAVPLVRACPRFYFGKGRKTCTVHLTRGLPKTANLKPVRKAPGLHASGRYGGNMKIDSLETLMTEELKDIYDAEKQITKALPKMVKAAESEDLKRALQEHLEITRKQIERLNQVFELMGEPAKGHEVAKREVDGDEMLGDAGIIGAAQKVEHYEMAAYGTLRNFAQKLGKEDVAELLEQTLEEEKEADEKLSQISEQLLEQAGSGIEEDELEMEDEDELDEDVDEEGTEGDGNIRRKAPQPMSGRASKRPATGRS